MRKAILLAMAAAIVAMFAIPASASAGWTKHHVTSTESATVEITGTDMFFDGEVGGVTCNTTISSVHFEVNVDPGPPPVTTNTTGTVTTFEPEGNVTDNCQGKGITAGCEVHEATADGLPWTIHTSTTNPDVVTVTTGTITNTLKGFLCPHTPSLTPGTVTMTVAAGETLTTSTAQLSGNLNGDGPGQVVEVKGTVHVLGTITYGI